MTKEERWEAARMGRAWSALLGRFGERWFLVQKEKQAFLFFFSGGLTFWIPFGS